MIKSGDIIDTAKRDPKSGRLEDPLQGLRLMVIDEEFYKGLRDKLYRTFESGASTILYEMGFGYGEVLGHRIKRMGSPNIALIGKLTALGKDHGWGEFSIPLLKTFLSGLKGEIVVSMKDCFYATSAGRTEKVECYIMAGVMAGVSGVLLGKQFNCVEEKCLAKGDERCEFRLKTRK